MLKINGLGYGLVHFALIRGIHTFSCFLHFCSVCRETISERCSLERPLLSSVKLSPLQKPVFNNQILAFIYLQADTVTLPNKRIAILAWTELDLVILHECVPWVQRIVRSKTSFNMILYMPPLIDLLAVSLLLVWVLQIHMILIYSQTNSLFSLDFNLRYVCVVLTTFRIKLSEVILVSSKECNPVRIGIALYCFFTMLLIYSDLRQTAH